MGPAGFEPATPRFLKLSQYQPCALWRRLSHDLTVLSYGPIEFSDRGEDAY